MKAGSPQHSILAYFALIKIKHRNNFSQCSMSTYHRENVLLLGQNLCQIFEKVFHEINYYFL